jgi:hypothetical protein
MKAVLSKAVGGPETLVLEDVPSRGRGPARCFAVVQVKAWASTSPTC